MAIPLWIVMVALAGEQIRAALRRRPLPARPRLSAALPQVPGLVALVLTALVAPTMLGTPNLASLADSTPGNNRVLVPEQEGNPEPSATPPSRAPT